MRNIRGWCVVCERKTPQNGAKKKEFVVKIKNRESLEAFLTDVYRRETGDNVVFSLSEKTIVWEKIPKGKPWLGEAIMRMPYDHLTNGNGDNIGHWSLSKRLKFTIDRVVKKIETALEAFQTSGELFDGCHQYTAIGILVNALNKRFLEAYVASPTAFLRKLILSDAGSDYNNYNKGWENLLIGPEYKNREQLHFGVGGSTMYYDNENSEVLVVSFNDEYKVQEYRYPLIGKNLGYASGFHKTLKIVKEDEIKRIEDGRHSTPDGGSISYNYVTPDGTIVGHSSDSFSTSSLGDKRGSVAYTTAVKCGYIVV